MDRTTNDNLIADDKAAKILRFLLTDGSIDLGDAESAMNKARRREILNEHHFAITQGKDGRWRTYVRIKDSKKKRKMLAKSSREKLEDAICDFYGTDPEEEKKKKATLASIFDDWIQYKGLHVAETTVERIKRDWVRYYKNATITTKPIRAIKKLELDTWVHGMIREHAMNKHKYTNFSVIIRQMLEYAVDLEIISKNPFRDVKVDTGRVLVPEHKKQDDTQVFSEQELADLKRVAWEDFYKKKHPVHQLTPLAVLFMFMTGVRIGELCALKYCDIQNGNIIVRRTVRGSYDNVVERTKGAFGDRSVPLIPQAIELIEKARERQRELGASDEGYLFSMNDKPLRYSSVTKAFYSYCREIGTRPKSSHKARKTFVSALIDAGVNLNTVRRIVGHVDERTTLNSYCFDRSTNEEKISKIARALE